MRQGLLAVLILVPGMAMASATGEIAAHKHMGVATCGNSVCHGSAQPFKDSNVMQNEFALWQSFDPHANKAYQALNTPEGQAIAKKLGLGDASRGQGLPRLPQRQRPTAERGDKFQ
jgi:hypothetical protein